MAFEAIKNKVGWGGSTKQYVDEGEANVPSEIQDPHTWRDETSSSFRDKLSNHKYRAMTRALFVVTGSIVLIGLLRRWLPEVYYSSIVRQTVGFLLFTATVFLIGAKWQRGQLKEFDWLVVNLPNSVEIYVGEFSTSVGTEEPTFRPVCGFTFAGTKSKFYTLGEMSDEMARHHSKQDREASDPIRMGLPRVAEEKSVDTWFGSVISVVSDGYEPSSTSEAFDVLVLPSARDHKETMESLIERLQKKDRRVGDLEDELANVREEKEKYRQQAKETREEVRKEMKNEWQGVLEAVNPGQRLRQQAAEEPSTTTDPTSVGNGDPLADVKEEIADD